jgi:hypothetical protein
MTCRVAVVALGLLTLAEAPLSAQVRPEPPFRTGWLGSLEEGQAQARKTGKPLMVVVRCQP